MLTKRAMWLCASLWASFGLVGCGGGSSSSGTVNTTGNGTLAGTYRNASVTGTTSPNATCPGSATNANTTFSCGGSDTLALNADGTYQMTGVDSAIIGSGTYTVSGNAITFNKAQNGGTVTAQYTQAGSQLNLTWTSDIFTGITLIYQKQ